MGPCGHELQSPSSSGIATSATAYRPPPRRLQGKYERKAELAALTRDELVGILTEIVQATRARLPEAGPSDGLKAAEMLAKDVRVE